ncbi:hypothetical protein CSB66_4420 [Enterobacter hormaechei]|nr:hypothetical protein CSC35_2558 [Enterobacter hormaechei]RCG83529.1 hypothetical protein CSB66_4420 [Enterobacter hormaechei]
MLMELLKSKNRNLTQCIRHSISVRIINEMLFGESYTYVLCI